MVCVVVSKSIHLGGGRVRYDLGIEDLITRSVVRERGLKIVNIFRSGGHLESEPEAIALSKAMSGLLQP